MIAKKQKKRAKTSTTAKEDIEAVAEAKNISRNPYGIMSTSWAL